MDKFRYVASCNFTLFYPELSRKIQDYFRTLPDIDIIRCCTKSYKIKDFEDRMPDEVKEFPRFRTTPIIWGLFSLCPMAVTYGTGIRFLLKVRIWNHS